MTPGPSSPATSPAPSTAAVTPLALASGGLLAIVATAFLVGSLHIISETAGTDPFRRTISEYALNAQYGWVFDLGVVLLAVGSMAIGGALVQRGLVRLRSNGIVMLSLWSAALVLLVIFPKHNWAVGPSLEGHLHRGFSLIAFISLPFAVLSIAREARARTGRRTGSLVIAGLGWLSLAWFAPLIYALMFADGPWYRAIPLGLWERGLAVTEVVAVIALGIWALQTPKDRTHNGSAVQIPPGTVHHGSTGSAVPITTR